MPAPGGDRGEIGVGEFVLIATGVVALVGVYASLGAGLWNQDAAVSVGLMSDGAIVNDHKSFLVSGATPGARWGEVKVLVDGDAYRYDDSLSGDRVFCVGTGSGCLTNASWGSGQALVTPGQKLDFRGDDLAGRTLRVVTADGASVVWSVPFGG